MPSQLQSNRDSITRRLDTRISERTNLLQQTITLLENDPRISAAWLTGSLSRDDHDALSDVDLWIVVADDSIEDIVQNKQQFAARLATPTLVLENMTNAPPSGAYLLAHYPGSVGPHHFDWFWQPESLARFPSNAKLLFDRANLTSVDGDEWVEEMHQTGNRPPINETDAAAVLTQKNAFFWAMSLTVAKYIARRDAETVDHMLSLVARTLNEIAHLLDVPAAEIDRIIAPETASLTPTEQHEMLLQLAHISTDMQPEIEAKSSPLAADAIDQITAFFDLTNDMVSKA